LALSNCIAAVLSVVGKNTPPFSFVVVVCVACEPAPVIRAVLASADALVTHVVQGELILDCTQVGTSHVHQLPDVAST